MKFPEGAVERAVRRVMVTHPLKAAKRELCEDCPPSDYPTDKTRCSECPRRAPPQTAERSAS